MSLFKIDTLVDQINFEKLLTSLFSIVKYLSLEVSSVMPQDLASHATLLEINNFYGFDMMLYGYYEKDRRKPELSK